MRRKEFEIRDPRILEEVLKTAETGSLCFNGPDGFPRVTPLNFLYDGRVLWHGGMAGERFECLERDPRATFCAVSAQAYVPSRLLAEENAAQATAAFQSVIVRGRCRSVEDPEEKCAVLNALMDKYQPEGRFRRLTPGDPLYAQILSATGVFALEAEEMAGKFKLAQNKPAEARQKIADFLFRRGLPQDLILAAAIRDTLKES